MNDDFYIAVALYESSSTAEDYQPLYQETFALIRASSIEEAQVKALAHARAEETSYTNAMGETIIWTLKHLIDVAPILEDTFGDGSELYARHFHNYAAYCLFEPFLAGEELE